ncbi:MAG: hypothetical protein C5B54_10475 [Acidobacteria bacterium]|nr:MAG: hypothetical protein C5B54_10475 [Acidobacteriota bacterium]
MSSDKNDELKSFQIGFMSGASTPQKKSSDSERFEVSKEDFPALSASVRSKATFKKKTGEKLTSIKQLLGDKSESPEEKERAEKAKKAWERALEVVNQVSIKD